MIRNKQKDLGNPPLWEGRLSVSCEPTGQQLLMCKLFTSGEASIFATVLIPQMQFRRSNFNTLNAIHCTQLYTLASSKTSPRRWWNPVVFWVCTLEVWAFQRTPDYSCGQDGRKDVEEEEAGRWACHSWLWSEKLCSHLIYLLLLCMIFQSGKKILLFKCLSEFYHWTSFIQ